MKKKIVVIIIVFIILFWIYRIQYPDVVTFTSKKEGPVLTIVGGTHGNEPAGANACFLLIEYLKKNPIKRGKVVVIPNANPIGLFFNKRNIPFELNYYNIKGEYDLNRNYFDKDRRVNTDIVTSQVLKSDWVLDLHEGWSFHKLDSASMGSGIYAGKTQESKAVIPFLVEAVNETIKDDEYKFISVDWPDLEGTLRMMCDNNKINYVLVETSGQNDVQPMYIRVEQHLVIIHRLLDYLKC